MHSWQIWQYLPPTATQAKGNSNKFSKSALQVSQHWWRHTIIVQILFQMNFFCEGSARNLQQHQPHLLPGHPKRYDWLWNNSRSIIMNIIYGWENILPMVIFLRIACKALLTAPFCPMEMAWLASSFYRRGVTVFNHTHSCHHTWQFLLLAWMFYPNLESYSLIIIRNFFILRVGVGEVLAMQTLKMQLWTPLSSQGHHDWLCNQDVLTSDST